MKKEYIERIQAVVERLHNCKATWLKSVPVDETYRGQTIFKGDVEVFALTGHPKAKGCYAWAYGDPEQFLTVLHLPPNTSARAAVKAAAAYQIRNSLKATE